MIPIIDSDFTEDLEEIIEPDVTFGINSDMTRVDSVIDGLEAVKQAVYIMLNIERYQYLIYSFDFGVELQDLIGEPIDYIEAELERRISDCLEQDDRITEVIDFEFGKSDIDKLLVSFNVNTIYGIIEESLEVVT
jgi:hypothetical protein